ncbi:MAG: DUF4276 family protein [Bacteroidales bacterium]
MHFEILVEELSAEKVMHNILPKMITGEHTYRIISYQGKMDMLIKLPVTLKGYAKWISDDQVIVVLVDRDNQDCHELKNSLEKLTRDANLTSKTNHQVGEPYSVLNRIAIEELEAWFFGDADAVRSAYPRASSKFERKAAYRNPDEIKGGTWEALERILQAGGYFKNGLRKIESANEISKFMEPLNNRSRSFQVFWEGISYCIENSIE